MLFRYFFKTFSKAVRMSIDYKTFLKKKKKNWFLFIHIRTRAGPFNTPTSLRTVALGNPRDNSVQVNYCYRRSRRPGDIVLAYMAYNTTIFYPSAEFTIVTPRGFFAAWLEPVLYFWRNKTSFDVCFFFTINFNWLQNFILFLQITFRLFHKTEQ